MSAQILCDICDGPAAEDRATIQRPVYWNDIFDICDDCFNEHLAPLLESKTKAKRVPPHRDPKSRLVRGLEERPKL